MVFVCTTHTHTHYLPDKLDHSFLRETNLPSQRWEVWGGHLPLWPGHQMQEWTHPLLVWQQYVNLTSNSCWYAKLNHKYTCTVSVQMLHVHKPVYNAYTCTRHSLLCVLFITAITRPHPHHHNLTYSHRGRGVSQTHLHQLLSCQSLVSSLKRLVMLKFSFGL